MFCTPMACIWSSWALMSAADMPYRFDAAMPTVVGSAVISATGVNSYEAIRGGDMKSPLA